MIDDQEVELEGETYLWSCDPNGSSKRSWRWMHVSDFMVPTTAQESKLNRILIEHRAISIAETLSFDEQKRFLTVLRGMGASDKDLEAAGLAYALAAQDLEHFKRWAFKDLPPAGRTPFNCRTLRDWFFQSRSETSPFDIKQIICLGGGPFDADAFSDFLQERGLQIVEKESASGVVVLGREGWDEDEIDDVIDRHVGRSLRIYSQEMLVAALANGEDPFFGGEFVLAAFKAGHPGLEFLSEGWPGWVQAWVTKDRSPTSASTFDGEFLQEESPIHFMGYKVGNNGIDPEARQDILSRAFHGHLPIVGPPGYMQKWGEPGSPTRLHQIAENIASYCRNARRRSSSMEQAIADWEDDLHWLKETFYHGHMRFHWPDTTV